MPERGYSEKRWAVENNPTLDVAQELSMKGKLTLEQELHMVDTKPKEEWIDETGDYGQFQEKREDAWETEWFNYDEVYGKD